MSTVGDAPLDTLTLLGRRVDDRISALLEAESARWSALGADAVEPLSSLTRMVLAGGKRMRPAFCYWAFVGAGGEPGDGRVVDAGAALELLHCFALVHDDVMDASVRRRGLPSVHADYGARHRDAGWRGESRRFGEGVAVLVGNFAFVYADLLMAGMPHEAVDVYTELRLEANMGQFLDMLGSARGGADRALARQICLYKSGKYTVERPLHLGAALAGCLSEFAPVLSAYGLPLGEAFQLRDDLLGAFGDPVRTGKPVGDDLREGKATTLCALARERAVGAAARLLAERLGAPDLADAEVAALQAVLVETGAKARVEARLEALVDEAVSAVAGSSLLPEAAQALTYLAYFVADRDH